MKNCTGPTCIPQDPACFRGFDWKSVLFARARGIINGRFYIRGRIIRLDEHGPTFVVRLDMRL